MASGLFPNLADHCFISNLHSCRMELLFPEDSAVTKGVVLLAIEKTLLEISKPILEKVDSMLYDNYKCRVSDCYEHPQYLNKVLKDLFGASYQVIVVKSIGQKVKEFLHHKPISEFLEYLGA